MSRVNGSALSRRNTIRRVCVSCILAAWLSLACLAQPAAAAITTMGDILPTTDPSTWTTGTSAYIGNLGTATLTINSGSAVSDLNAKIGTGDTSTGEVTVDGNGSTWTNGSNLTIGYYGNGTLNITNGGAVIADYSYIAKFTGSTGDVSVDGSGSSWTHSGPINVGFQSDGTLTITNGGAVSNSDGFLGVTAGSSGQVAVDGSGSSWANSGDLYVGYDGEVTLSIINGGLVSVTGTLTIDDDTDGDGFIDMATGGMLAILGDVDDSLASFLGIIDGTDAIRYWDSSSPGWADITGATNGVDYTLDYLTIGSLAGYTVLTVQTPVPEPATLSLLAIGACLPLLKKRTWK